MGTRNLTAVYAGGELKVAQYCQWDGYPEGQGLSALNILRETNLDDLRERAMACSWITNDEFRSLWQEAGADDSGFVDMEVSARFEKAHPELHRNCGAEVLKLLPAKLVNSINFAGESLFCEWAYVVDFDQGVFEVYEGFNKEEPKGRFVDAPVDEDSDYKPVTLVASWPLHKLPTKEEFLEQLAETEDA